MEYQSPVEWELVMGRGGLSGHLSVPSLYSTAFAESAKGLCHLPLLEHGEMGCSDGGPQWRGP